MELEDEYKCPKCDTVLLALDFDIEDPPTSFYCFTCKKQLTVKSKDE